MKTITVSKVTAYLSLVMLEIVIIFSVTISVISSTDQLPRGTVTINDQELLTYSSEKFGYKFNYPRSVSLNDSLGTSYYDDSLLLLEMYLDYYAETRNGHYYSEAMQCQSHIAIYKDQKPINSIIRGIKDDKNLDIIDFQVSEHENYTDLTYSYKNTVKNYFGDSAYQDSILYDQQRMINFYKDNQASTLVVKMHYIAKTDDLEHTEGCLKNAVNQKSIEEYEQAYATIINSLQLDSDDLNNINTDNWLEYFAEDYDLYFKYPDSPEITNSWYVAKGKQGELVFKDPRDIRICQQKAGEYFDQCIFMSILYDQPEPYNTNPTIQEITEQISAGVPYILDLNREELKKLTKDKIMVGGKEALRVISEFNSGSTYTSIFLEHNNRIISIGYSERNEWLFNKIIESISFEPYPETKL